MLFAAWPESNLNRPSAASVQEPLHEHFLEDPRAVFRTRGAVGSFARSWHEGRAAELGGLELSGCRAVLRVRHPVPAVAYGVADGRRVPGRARPFHARQLRRTVAT